MKDGNRRAEAAQRGTAAGGQLGFPLALLDHDLHGVAALEERLEEAGERAVEVRREQEEENPEWGALALGWGNRSCYLAKRRRPSACPHAPGVDRRGPVPATLRRRLIARWQCLAARERFEE